MRILATVVLAVIASAPQAFAQSSELPRGLIGAFVMLSDGDPESRMRLGGEARPWVLAGELGVRLAPRFGIGAEAIDLGIATGETRGASFHSTGEQRERAVVGLMRVRVTGRERIAFDLVGGAGALFQRHTAETAPCFSGCAVSSPTAYSHRAPVLVAGADMPIRFGRRFSIAAIGRYYGLRRGDNTPDDPRQPIPWQFEHHSSARFGVGGSARVTW